METEGLCYVIVNLGIQVENTVRWRYARDEHGNMTYDELGNQLKESNARVVRWSDGRYSSCFSGSINYKNKLLQ